MSTRKSASLDGSLLARKGNAAPAVPESARQMDAFDVPRRGTARLSAGARPAPPPRSGGPLGGRFAPMTRSARGLVALVSIALLAVVLVAAERMRPPADPIEVAATPAVPQPAGAPVSDAKPVAPSGSADERAFPAESQPAPKPLLVPASATVATPAPPVAEPEPPATRVESAVVAAVVSDAPPPPAAPVRKKPVVARATPEKAPPVKPSAPVGPYMLQLAAFASEKSAYGEAARLQKALGTVLGERKVMVVEGANAEKKPIWRLRASSYPTLATARAACQSIRKLKTGCLVIRR